MKQTTSIRCIVLIVTFAASMNSFSQAQQNNYLKGGKHGGYTSAEFGESDLRMGLNENETQVSDIRIYPNPVADLLQIEIPGESADILLQVITASGSILNSQSVTKDETLGVKIDVSQIPPGMYLLKVFYAGKTDSHTFVKQ